MAAAVAAALTAAALTAAAAATAHCTTVNTNFHAARFVCFFAFPFDFPRCSTLTDPAYIYSIDTAPRFVNAGTSISSDADSGTTNGETEKVRTQIYLFRSR